MAIALALVTLPVAPAFADLVSDLANATIIEDFRFDDASGVSYDAAANTASPGNLLSTDTTPADLAGVTTNGSGALNASLKSNTNFGTTLVDTPDLTTGRVFGVMRATWDFQSTLDTSENEEIRLTLISSGTAGVLAEWEVQREDNDTLTILGNTVNGDGGLTQTLTFVGVIEADLDEDTYAVHYSLDGGATYTTIGTGDTDPTRNLDKMRIVLNNDLSGDNVLIDRAYLAIAAIPEPTGVLFMAVAFTPVALTAFKRRRG